MLWPPLDPCKCRRLRAVAAAVCDKHSGWHSSAARAATVASRQRTPADGAVCSLAPFIATCRTASATSAPRTLRLGAFDLAPAHVLADSLPSIVEKYGGGFFEIWTQVHAVSHCLQQPGLHSRPGLCSASSIGFDPVGPLIVVPIPRFVRRSCSRPPGPPPRQSI